MADAAELGRRFFKGMDAGDADAAMASFGPDVRFWSPAGEIHGTEAVRGFLGAYLEAIPDGRFQLGAVVSSGSNAAIEGVYSGTHTGTFRSPAGDVPATGRSVSIPFVTLVDADGDVVTSHRAYWDQMSFMAQLGLIPEPPAG